jgi:two-component sensor histidine kinase/HAMP domain-containing protein
MKLQYKAAGLMTFLGIIILIFITVIYLSLTVQSFLKTELQKIESMSEEIAHHMNTQIEANINISRSISSAPVIMNALIISNREYTSLTASEQNNKIDKLNKKWMEAEKISDPFVQQYLANSVAEFLKFQSNIIPGLYGEIFLTNQYGAMIASTGKLTTLAHFKKYWWIAAYDNGKGRVFLDDRGFDASVEGYVLGIVVPIMDKNKIIGILKSNINLEGPLINVIQNFELVHSGNIQIVRTNGFIIAEEGVIPLSDIISENIVQHLQKKKLGSETIVIDGKKGLVAFAPIPLTLGTAESGFGGKNESNDHIEGNEGEAWHIVITLDENTAKIDASETTKILLIAGIFFIILIALSTLLLGKWLANPLIKLSAIAHKIGKGQLNSRADISSADEIGKLAHSINMMAENLTKTLTSRDNLVLEIKLRERAEEKIQNQLDEKEIILKEVHHRIKNNFTSIVSLLSLQAESISNTEAYTILQEAMGRINSMAILYEKMLITDDYHTTSVKQYLSSIIDEIVYLFAKNQKIIFKKEISNFQLNPKKLIPIGIILNELLTNIIKYAFMGRTSGLIEIMLIKNDDDITLIIQDNGIGLPVDFDMEKQTGFGLMLIKMLTEQIKGKFTLESNNGTRSTLKFKI